MHALGEYLSREIERRSWTAAELARRSGLTKQSISNLMAADKTQLGRMLERRTFAGLAEALGVPAETVVLKAAEAMGIPVPPPHGEQGLDEAPPVTMEELVGFLRSAELPLPLLASYLHRYLRLADVTAQIMAERAADDDPPGQGGTERNGRPAAGDSAALQQSLRGLRE
jgi:transcriptional regulator with XRE-family HTH domain